MAAGAPRLGDRTRRTLAAQLRRCAPEPNTMSSPASSLLAMGDELSKQTESLSFEDTPAWYPVGVQGFEGTPGGIIPRYRGRRYKWRIGESTADAEPPCRAALTSTSSRHYRVLLKTESTVVRN